MATLNVSGQYQAATRRWLAKEVLPITTSYLVAQQFAMKEKMQKGAGVTWTATRFNRLPLPIGPLSEGVPPIGEQLSISQVTGVALQWGDKVTTTDVAQVATMYDLIKQNKRLLGVQLAETMERNTFGVLMGGTQVNYVNQRGSRASIQAGDVLDTVTINRTFADLDNAGAPYHNGQVQPTVTRDINHGANQSEKGPKTSDHYVAIIPVLVEGDLRQNPTIVNAWSYGDVTRLYINEVGYWSGIHFTRSNMTPRFTGIASVTATGNTGGGSLTAGTYNVQVTGTDTLNKYGESQIYQIQTGLSVGASGTVTLTTPATAGYTYSVYVDTNSIPSRLGLSASGPTSGIYAGQAVQIPPSTAVTITGLGLYQIPPAAPATGVTVFPTFVFGQQYYACTELEDVSWTSLMTADKSDPLNQLRVIGYKFFQGYVILNQAFGCRIESSVSNTGAFG